MLKKSSDTRASVEKSRVIATLSRVGRWTLVVIVLSLALIGFLHLTRGTAVRHVRGVTADGAPISVSEPEFPLMATMATGAWLAPGNRVEVMLNGDGIYPRLWKICGRRGGRSPCSCITAPPDVWPTRSVRYCVNAPKRASGCSSSTTPSVRWTFRRAIATSYGLPAFSLNPFGLSVSRHSISLKTARMCEGSSSIAKWVGLAGSASTTSGSATDTATVRGAKPTCASRAPRFDNSRPRSLRRGSRRPARCSRAGPPSSRSGMGSLRALLYTAPTLGSTAAERFFALSISGARNTLSVTNWSFAPDRCFIDLLAAAARRGVDVRILTAGRRTDVNVVRLAGRA